MIISESAKNFNEKQLPDLIKELVEMLSGLDPTKQAAMYCKQSLKCASYMLEQADVENMTTNPIEYEKHDVYIILEKITQDKWKIADKDGQEKVIIRGKDGVFKLNYKNIYCCPPPNYSDKEAQH